MVAKPNVTANVQYMYLRLPTSMLRVHVAVYHFLGASSRAFRLFGNPALFQPQDIVPLWGHLRLKIPEKPTHGTALFICLHLGIGPIPKKLAVFFREYAIRVVRRSNSIIPFTRA